MLDSSNAVSTATDDGRPVKKRKLTSATELLASLPLPTLPYYQTALPAVKPANPDDDQSNVNDVLVDEAMATGSSSEDNDFQPGASPIASLDDSDVEETSSEGKSLELPPTEIGSRRTALIPDLQQDALQVDDQSASVIASPQYTPASPPPPARREPARSEPQPHYAPISPPMPSHPLSGGRETSPRYTPASPAFSPDIQLPTAVQGSAPTKAVAGPSTLNTKTVFATAKEPPASESTSSSSSDSSSSSSSSSEESSSDEEEQSTKPIQHLTSVAKALPATKSGLTMPALYHPDIIKPAYFWVAKLVGFTEADFPKLAGAVQPADASLDKIPCSAQVTAWIAAGRQAEASRYVQRQKERHLKKPQAPPGKGKTATQNRNARRRAKQQADKAKELLKSNGVPAIKQPTTAQPVAASFVQPPPGPDSHPATISTAEVSPSIPLTNGSSIPSSAPKPQSKPIDRFAKLLGHMMPKSSSPMSAEASTSSILPPSVPLADEIDSPMTAASSSRPAPPAVDEIAAAKAAAMQSLNSMEERDLQMLSSKNKNKSKNKKNRKKDASGADAHVRFFGNQTEAKSRVVPPAAPSSRSNVPDNIIISWVDVEDQDWVPGQATVQLRGAGVKQKGYELEGEWKGYPSAREVVDEHWRSWKRALTGDTLQDGDKIAFQVSAHSCTDITLLMAIRCPVWI